MAQRTLLWVALLLSPRVAEAQTVRLDTKQIESIHRIKTEPIADVAHLANALLRVGVSPGRAEDLAGWFVRYGRETRTDPTLLAAIALHESGMKESAYNPKGGGSISVMQVVPQAWLKRYTKACEVAPTRANLRKSRVSICYGAHIYAYFKSTAHGDQRRALRGYNSGFRYLNNGYDRKVMKAYTKLGGE